LRVVTNNGSLIYFTILRQQRERGKNLMTLQAKSTRRKNKLVKKEKRKQSTKKQLHNSKIRYLLREGRGFH
jgi:hypothetical protein